MPNEQKRKRSEARREKASYSPEIAEVLREGYLERREKAKAGLVKYKTFWLSAYEVELVMETALRHLRYGIGRPPNHFLDRKDRIIQSIRSSSVDYNFAVMENRANDACREAIQVLGRERALQYWKRKKLSEIIK